MSRFHCFSVALIGAACLAAGCSSNDGGQGGCPSGQIFCGSVCATLGSDPQNCGACGAACGTGQACVGGVCAASCGTGATSCRNDGGLLVCVNLKSDNQNCGACGHACPAGEYCNGLAGCAASCPAGNLSCGATCANPLTDNANCGFCGHACPGGQVCSGGLCKESCATGYTTCVLYPDGGVDGGFDAGLLPDGGLADGGSIYGNGTPYCANLLADPQNCGACGNVCGQGRACCLVGEAATCLDIQQSADNCGACNHSCQGGGCTAGLCNATQLAAGYNPSDIKVDSTYVYFTATFSVNQMLTDGGSLRQVSMGSFSPESVCVNSTDIYWPDTTDLIWDAPINNPDGGANIVGLLFPLPNPIPFGSSVDDASFYYAGFSDAGTTPCPGYGCVLSFPLHGFGYTTVASGNFQPNGITLDSQHVYWTDVLNGQVMMADRTGLNPKTLATGQAGPAGIAVDALNVYWANSAGGTIMMRPFDGGSLVTLASGLSEPSRVVADSAYVYWTDHDAGTVARAPIAGGSTVILAAQQKGPIGIAQDATHIYWTDNGAALNTGTVMKVPK